MCQLKSGIITRDGIFIPEYNSHTNMLDEMGIADTLENAKRLFVRAELTPKNGDVFTPIDDWNFNIDQDVIPEWFVNDYEKARMIEAVKEWARTHIFDGVDNLKIGSGQNHYIRNCKDVEIYGSATVKCIYGSATVKCIYGSATVKCICGSATVNNICDYATVNNIYGSATVNNICDYATVNNICDYATVNDICDYATVNNICDYATVNDICDSATVNNICDYATVIGSQGGWNKKSTLIISENATFKDCETKTIYQSGDWKFVAVENKGGAE